MNRRLVDGGPPHDAHDGGRPSMPRCAHMDIWLARGGLAALVLVAQVARPTAAHAQGAGAGTVLDLPVLGVKVTVPNGVGEWIVRQDDGGDVLQRTRPVNPYLSILFSSPDAAAAKHGKGCVDTMAAFARKGLKKLDRAALVPAGWSKAVLTASSSGENLIAFCAENEAGDRQLVALVTYSAAVDAPDLASVTPVLEVVGKAVLAAPPAAPAAPHAPAAKPPTNGKADEDTDAYRDAPPQEITLPRSGLVLLVGGGQKWEAKPGKGNRDLVRRTEPEDPTLSVALEVVRGSHEDSGGCASLLDQYLATRGKGSLQSHPGYLPDDFHPSAAESYDGGTGRALTCAEVPTGYLLATIAYSGSLDAEDARAARPVLIAALHAASSVGAATHHKSSRSVLWGHSFWSPELYLAGQRSLTADEASNMGMIGDGNGVAAGVRQAGMLHFSPGSVFGLAGRYLVAGGWDAQNGLFFEGIFGIGLGIQMGPLTLLPMAGGGGDAIGAGSDDKATDKLVLDFDIFDYYGGVIDLELTDLLALELSGGYCNRGEIRELRYDGKLIALPRTFRKLSIGVSYVDIEKTAKLWQLTLGMGF
jgi:hypothetical protein